MKIKIRSRIHQNTDHYKGVRDRHTNTQTNRYTDRQTHRQTDTQTHRHRQTDAR